MSSTATGPRVTFWLDAAAAAADAVSMATLAVGSERSPPTIERLLTDAAMVECAPVASTAAERVAGSTLPVDTGVESGTAGVEREVCAPGACTSTGGTDTLSAGTDAELSEAGASKVRARAVPSVVDWLSTPTTRAPSSAPLLPSRTLSAVTDSVPVPTPVVPAPQAVLLAATTKPADATTTRERILRMRPPPEKGLAPIVRIGWRGHHRPSASFREVGTN